MSLEESWRSKACAADGGYLRKPLVGDVPMDAFIKARVTPDIKRRFLALAHKTSPGMSESDFLRKIVEGLLTGKV